MDDGYEHRLTLSRLVAAGGGGTIAVLGLLGALVAKHRLHAGALDLDHEYTVPAFWSGLLLLAAAAAAALAHSVLRWRALIAIGVLLAYMGIDEIAGIHEHLESATGVDWQVLLAPLVLLGGVAFVVLLRRLGPRFESLLLVAGAGAWAVSQLLERWEWDGDVARPGYLTKMVPEETLEMLGSLLILVALLRLWERARARQNGERPASAGLSEWAILGSNQ